MTNIEQLDEIEQGEQGSPEKNNSELTFMRVRYLARLRSLLMGLMALSVVAPIALHVLYPSSQPSTRTGCTGTVMLYGEVNFSGWVASFIKGRYDHHQFLGQGAKNDAAGSLRVPHSCMAILYENGDFNANMRWDLEQGIPLGVGWEVHFGPGS